MTEAKDFHVEREITALETLDRAALLERWRLAFRGEPPPRMSRSLMKKAIAYDIQVKAYGGLSLNVIRALKAAVKPKALAVSHRQPGAGARLVREWNGVLHEVEVLNDGYVWGGEQYRSLSAIALAITGAKWSGPRFFGLKTG